MLHRLGEEGGNARRLAARPSTGQGLPDVLADRELLSRSIMQERADLFFRDGGEAPAGHEEQLAASYLRFEAQNVRRRGRARLRRDTRVGQVCPGVVES